MKIASLTWQGVWGLNKSPQEKKQSLMPKGLSYRPRRHVKKRSGFEKQICLVKNSEIPHQTPSSYQKQKKKCQCYCLHSESFQSLATRSPFQPHLHNIRHFGKVNVFWCLSFLIIVSFFSSNYVAQMKGPSYADLSKSTRKSTREINTKR